MNLLVLFSLFWSLQSSPVNNAPKAQIFEPGVITKPEAWSFTPTFSQDGQALVYARWDNPDYTKGDQSIQKLYVSRKKNGRWTMPKTILETSGSRVDWPHFSPDGKHFLLSYNKYHAGQYDFPNQKKWDDFDLWIADCDASGKIDWDTFKPIQGSDINRAKTPQNARIRYVHNETSPRMDLEGNLYFWSERLDQGIGRRDIYYVPVTSKNPLSWGKTELLLRPINSTYKESGVCISNDGQWMIFASERPGGLGQSDLYFAKKEKNKWMDPILLGPAVNTMYGEGGPQLSPDNQTLYFTSSRPIPGVKAPNPGEGQRVFQAIYFIEIADIPAIDLP
ncbi:MAG: hypothetical protein Sapg2KO_39250 [Saprospiraceae bacterium]